MGQPLSEEVSQIKVSLLDAELFVDQVTGQIIRWKMDAEFMVHSLGVSSVFCLEEMGKSEGVQRDTHHVFTENSTDNPMRKICVLVSAWNEKILQGDEILQALEFNGRRATHCSVILCGRDFQAEQRESRLRRLIVDSGIECPSIDIRSLSIFTAFELVPRVIMIPAKSNGAEAIAESFKNRGWKPEVYSAGGKFAEKFAERVVEITTFKDLKESPLHIISLVVIDRIADLTSVLGHGDHLMDRIFRRLPRDSIESPDVIIPMNASTPLHDPIHFENLNSAGCICHFGDKKASNLLHSLACSNEREAFRILYNHLAQAADSTSFPLYSALYAQGPYFRERIQYLIKCKSQDFNFMKETANIVELSQAAIESTKSSSLWDDIASFENVLRSIVLNNGSQQVGESTLNLVSKYIKSNSQRGLALMDALSLITYVYFLNTLRGEGKYMFSEQDREEVVKVLRDEYANDDIFKQLDSHLSSDPTHATTLWLKNTLKAIETYVSQSHAFSKSFCEMTKNASSDNIPLMAKLISGIFDPQDDLSYLNYHSGSKQTGKAGHRHNIFNKLMLQARQRPDKRNIIVLYMLQGMSWLEIRETLVKIKALKDSGKIAHEVDIYLATSTLITASTLPINLLSL